MSTQVPVPTRDCVGIDVTRNGQVVASYDAHNGYVNVGNRSHARLLERTFGSRKQLAIGAADGAATEPCTCGRRNKFVGQQVCGLCHMEALDQDVTAGS